MKKIVITVTNDISTDQRVYKFAVTLSKLNYSVEIIGRKRKKSFSLNKYLFKTKRFRLVFNKGPLFYFGYNLRLFFYLLFKKYDIQIAVDLDTLPANYVVSKIKHKKLIYDSHEYFTEVPELANRKRTKKIWNKIEAVLLPKLSYAITVNESIANIYYKHYGLKFEVIRNFPLRINKENTTKQSIAKSDSVIIYQGAVNMGRGLELAIEAMQFLDATKLLIIGDGDIKDDLIKKTENLKLEKKVEFIGRLTWDKMTDFTLSADLGISLERNIGLNYYYALPNKLFDYIQAEIPVLVSAFPEMSSIVREYNIGETTDTEDPKILSGILKDMLFNINKRKEWSVNLHEAAKQLCWENEETHLIDFFRKMMC